MSSIWNVSWYAISSQNVTSFDYHQGAQTPAERFQGYIFFLNYDKNKYIALPYDPSDSLVFLNADYCKMIMQILGVGARWYTYGPHRPVLIESERGRALIVPVRMTGNGEKEYREYIAAQRVGA